MDSSRSILIITIVPSHHRVQLYLGSCIERLVLQFHNNKSTTTTMATTRLQKAGKSRPNKSSKGKSTKKSVGKVGSTTKTKTKAHVVGGGANTLDQRALDLANKLLPHAKKAQCVGGPAKNTFEYWDIFPSLLCFTKDKITLLAQNDKKLWIYQASEALDKVTHKDIIEKVGSHDVPVLVAIICELPPTTFVATNSLQLQERAFYSIQEKNLFWKEVLPRVNILQATPIAFGQLLDYEYTLLPIMQPSKLYGKETEKSLDCVEVEVNGLIFSASKVSDVDAALEDEEDEAKEESRAPRATTDERADIIAKLKETKREKEAINLALLEKHTSHYHGMISSHAESLSIERSSVASKLETMEIYKIYPLNLPPPKTWQYFQSTGFRKNTMVNRFTGDCDGYYPKSN